MLDAGFVAAVLEGFEGTLDEVVGRVASPELRADLAVLQTRINVSFRQSWVERCAPAPKVRRQPRV
jgi:hypothetical protein